MSPIDYEPWRDFFRTLITGGATPIVNPILFVKEGKAYDGDFPLWVEEVVGIDGEVHLTSINEPGLQLTITYNIYADKQLPDPVKPSEKLRRNIGAVCMDNFPPIGNISIYEISVKRRIATSQEGLRLSPLDVSFKLCNNQTQGVSP